MSENEVCQIWGTRASPIPNSRKGRDGHYLDSPRAGGEYFISRTATEVLKKYDERIKARLTTWLIDQRWLGEETPEVGTSTVKEVKKRQNLSSLERADRLLKYIVQEVQSIGGRFNFSRDESSSDFMKMLAWSESTRSQEVESLVDHLQKQGYLKTYVDRERAQLELTVSGYGRIEELRWTCGQTIARLTGNESTTAEQWNVFICHATEDKENVARPLAKGLISRGYLVWYDEFTLTVGDSLLRSIDCGLAQSRFGVVVISPNFFAKEWPQNELAGLFAREVQGTKVILPVWHKITAEEVLKYSPILADRVSIFWDEGLDQVLEDLEEAINPSKLL